MIINIHYLKFNNMAGLKGEKEQSILLKTFYLMIGLLFFPFFLIQALCCNKSHVSVVKLRCH